MTEDPMTPTEPVPVEEPQPDASPVDEPTEPTEPDVPAGTPDDDQAAADPDDTPVEASFTQADVDWAVHQARTDASDQIDRLTVDLAVARGRIAALTEDVPTDRDTDGILDWVDEGWRTRAQSVIDWQASRMPADRDPALVAELVQALEGLPAATDVPRALSGQANYRLASTEAREQQMYEGELAAYARNGTTYVVPELEAAI